MTSCEAFTTADYARKSCHTCGRRIAYFRGNRAIKGGWRHCNDMSGIAWRRELRERAG